MSFARQLGRSLRSRYTWRVRGESGLKERKRRAPPKLTEPWLREQAVRYLQRWPASEARLRELLWKRVRRANEHHGGEPEQAVDMVESVVAALRMASMLDDERLAQAWQRTLRLRGTSQRKIAMKLREKGVPSELIRQVQQDERAEQEETGGDPERASAVAYARRRRLGPFRREIHQQ